MRKVLNLNHKWAFTKEAGELPSVIPQTWNWVNLPHTWNAIDGQDGGNDYYRGTCFYAKQIEKVELPECDQYYLEFQGANASASVYVNGKKMGSHDGGYSTWRVNVTEGFKEDNLIVVEVDNQVNEKVYPQHADFTFYGGLYRSVNLIGVSHSHFELDYFGGPGIKVTPVVREKDAEVKVEVFLKNPKEGQELFYCLKRADGSIEAEKRGSVSETEMVFSISDVHLWNGKKDPYLYTAEVTLREKEEELDMVSARFGCRTYRIDPEKGFILNNNPYPLRGVSRHQDRLHWGNALLPKHHKEDMDLICEMGANTIRLAHYQHDSYFYDLCDERGMVVWAEIPYISRHMPEGRENTLLQMKELVLQNYNHPSIIVWGLSNEITMTGKSSEDLLENHRMLNDMVHRLDSTRLTTIAVVSMCDIHDPYIQIPDVVAYNHYFGWYGGDTSMNGPWFDRFHAEFPNLPIAVSEYGCEALNWHTSDPQQGDYTEEYQAFYHEELIKQLFTRPYIWATYVWNMFDFGADAREEGGENGQNHKGLVTFDRKYKKDSFYAYKAWLSSEPFVHICGKRYVERVESETKITVYSNQPEVELFVNGKSLGRLKSKVHFFSFIVPNEGDSKIVAEAGKCRDESRIRKVSVFNEEYRLKEKGAVLNWFDITQKEGCFSLQDKVGDIMASRQGKEVLGEVFSKIGGIMGEKENSFLHAENRDGLLQMMGEFTLLRLIKLMGAANASFTKEQLLKLNEKLNQIKK